MSTIILTSIYSPNEGTKQFLESCKITGFPVENVFTDPVFTGNGRVIQLIYEALLRNRNKYDNAIYADGADSLFVAPFIVPKGIVTYSTEKAIWEPLPALKQAWDEYYKPFELGSTTCVAGFTIPGTSKHSFSSWKYLNGGGYCGPIELLIEFFENFLLPQIHASDVNAQSIQAFAFLDAFNEGFPIQLDTECENFQTVGHAHKNDFTIVSNVDEKYCPVFINNITHSQPALIHGNGRTDMRWLYKAYENVTGCV